MNVACIEPNMTYIIIFLMSATAAASEAPFAMGRMKHPVVGYLIWKKASDECLIEYEVLILQIMVKQLYASVVDKVEGLFLWSFHSLIISQGRVEEAGEREKKRSNFLAEFLLKLSYSRNLTKHCVKEIYLFKIIAHLSLR